MYIIFDAKSVGMHDALRLRNSPLGNHIFQSFTALVPVEEVDHSSRYLIRSYVVLIQADHPGRDLIVQRFKTRGRL